MKRLAMIPKKRVILESPYAGDIERNTRYARACLRDSLHRGEAPLASHLLYTQPNVLNDNDIQERSLGIDAGHAWLPVTHTMVVYTDLGISPGMQQGIDRAAEQGVIVVFRSLGKSWGS